MEAHKALNYAQAEMRSAHQAGHAARRRRL